MADKYCFMNAQRPCDLTCKAAFEVDDPVDNIDCSFVWLAFHFGEGVLEMRRNFEGGGEGGPPGPGPMPGFGPTPKGPKGVSNN
jgi:hypothetical protein